MSRVLRREDFERHLNSFFEVRTADRGSIPVELVAVDDRSNAAMDAFSLLFRGAKEHTFRHDTYTLVHPAMGELVIFLGPVYTGAADVVYYQAVFNSLKGGVPGT